MAAVMTTSTRQHLRPVHPMTRSCSTPIVARRGEPIEARSVVRTPAIFWRRRVAAVVIAVGMLAVAGKAGAALGGPTLAGPPRSPSIVTYVVQPGDSLWSVAQRLEPGRDPRPIVDELAKVRHGSDLQPGETIVWQR